MPYEGLGEAEGTSEILNDKHAMSSELRLWEGR